MRWGLAIWAAAVLAMTGASAEDELATLRVMSFNIRFDNPDDAPNDWASRRDHVASVIRFHRADVVGLQEALRSQIDDLIERLPGYEYYGVGRDDGGDYGEMTAVLYRRDRVIAERTGTRWCSPTPTRPSRGWDSTVNRTITIVHFRDRRSDRRFELRNTQFDHRGGQSRAECAGLLLGLPRMLDGGAPRPVVVTSDLNVDPGSEAYRILTGAPEEESEEEPAADEDGAGDEEGDLFLDARMASEAPPHGPAGSFTDFDIAAAPDAPTDFIFVTPGLTVRRFATLTDSLDGRLPSNHYPLIADIALTDVRRAVSSR
ncbi:MAG: endonuclease/exonuclease/phosphatase family protein [Caulobacterales bacterium]|nr:endonuclease/exonuclease/phosphatase family protein [Caulobacterales bacterium]